MEDFMKKEFTLDRVVRIVISVLLCVGGLYLLNTLSSVLTPFVFAAILAYMINPLVNLIQKKIKNRALSVILAIAVIGAVFTGLFYLIIPMIKSEFQTMGTYFEKYTSKEYLEGTQNQLNQLFGKYIGEEQLNELMHQENMVKLSQKGWSYVKSLFDSSLKVVFGLLSIVSMIIYLVFILIDYQLIMYGWQKLIPKRYRGVLVDLVEDLKDGMNNYFRAQSLVVLCVSVLFAIGFSLIGLPMGLVFGIFVGMLNFIPYMQLASLPIAAFLALVHSLETGMSYGASIGLTLLVYVVVQTLQDTIIVPKLMSKVTGFNAAVILLALSVWGSLLGMLGMLIALPVTTIIYSYYQRYLKNSEDEEQLKLFEDEE